MQVRNDSPIVEPSSCSSLLRHLGGRFSTKTLKTSGTIGFGRTFFLRFFRFLLMMTGTGTGAGAGAGLGLGLAGLSAGLGAGGGLGLGAFGGLVLANLRRLRGGCGLGLGVLEAMLGLYEPPSGLALGLGARLGSRLMRLFLARLRAGGGLGLGLPLDEELSEGLLVRDRRFLLPLVLRFRIIMHFFRLRLRLRLRDLRLPTPPCSGPSSEWSKRQSPPLSGWFLQ